jgi:hypothetical protein
MVRTMFCVAPATILPTPADRAPPRWVSGFRPVPHTEGGPVSPRASQGGKFSASSWRLRLPPSRGSGTSTWLLDPLGARADTPSRGKGSGTATRSFATSTHGCPRPWPARPTGRRHATSHSDDHAAYWSQQDAGAISARSRTTPMMTATPDVIPHSVLPIVLDYCKRRPPRSPVHVPVPPCVYKRRRRAPPGGSAL